MRNGTSPVGLHRVLDPAGVLPQAAWRLDATPEIGPDEVRIAAGRLVDRSRPDRTSASANPVQDAEIIFRHFGAE